MIRKLVLSLRSVVFVGFAFFGFFSFTGQAFSQSSFDSPSALDRWRVELGWQHAQGRFFLSPAAPGKRNKAVPVPEDRLPLAYNTTLIASVHASVYLANASTAFADGRPAQFSDHGVAVQRREESKFPVTIAASETDAAPALAIYRADISFANLPVSLVFARSQAVLGN